MDPSENPQPDTQAEPPRASRWTWLIPLILLLAFSAWPLLAPKPPQEPPVSYSQLYVLAQAGKVAHVTIEGQDIAGTLKAPEPIGGKSIREFRSVAPEHGDEGLLKALREHDADITFAPARTSFFGPLLITLLPWVLIVGAWVFIARRLQRTMPGGAGPFGMMRSRPHRFERQDAVRIRFDDVAGLQSAKRDLREVVDFLREPARFRRIGAKLPRGVLLIGPPGTGKTLLARAVAGEAECPFFYVNGSEFIQLFVGVGASRVRELFDDAKKSAPSIVFIDEIDAVGRARGAGIGGGNDEREQTLNQLLSEMDGFTRSDMTVVVAATNRPDVLDTALLRPGRFDRRVVVDRPEAPAREEILKIHTRDKPLAPDVSLHDLAANTPGFAGADLENFCNEAALIAMRRGAENVAAVDFAQAMDKIILGDPRETLLDKDERRRVAIHESGHAVVAHFTKNAEPLRRVSILPRGMSLGATQQTPMGDRHLATQDDLEAKLRVMMGGYAAENLLLGTVSTGSENDLRQATDLAFKMVAHYGMSDRIGPVFHEQRAEHPFLGQKLASDAGISDETEHEIEDEARHILSEAVVAAKATIEEHRGALLRLVDALLEHETLEMSLLEPILRCAEEGAPIGLVPAPAQ
jgi:cell division protease FtsH